MSFRDINLMAHLMRRAGFGAGPDELGAGVKKGYQVMVEELLHPTDPRNMPDDIIRRFHTDLSELRLPESAAAYWMYRMVTTQCPLEEKLTLFWHGLFATNYAKLNQAKTLLNQIEMFRRHGLGSFSTLLVNLSKDPAMVFWLDNEENHKDAINENYGRELLELFSMGIGNYTEEDVKECARAFTGWTLENAEYMAIMASQDSVWPYGRIAWHFKYRDHDHDDGEKTFLGETGRFNGEEIVEIIARQEATARFISTRLFQFFAADEVDDEGEQVIDAMMQTYFDSHYEIRSVLRTLFNSAFFKSEKARYARMKGPVEMVVGAIRLAGSYQQPTQGLDQVAKQTWWMGQGLLRPPTVEGWQEGIEWVDSGNLIQRANFVAQEMANIKNPGVRKIIDRLAGENRGVLSPEALVDRCLELLGHLMVSGETRAALVEFVSHQGDLSLASHNPGDEAERRVGVLLGLAISTMEFQLA